MHLPKATPPPGPSPVREGRLDLVQLDADHPGFRDPLYRARREEIARLALAYESGTSVPLVEYTREERETWAAIWHALRAAHPAHLCRRVREALERLGLNGESVPQLEHLSARLEAESGMRVEPVAGLVSARAFFEALRRGVLFSTQYLRHPSQPLYTPEPDLVHEAVGHAASLLDPQVAALNRAFGEVAHGADEARMLRLERIYWWTMEFGLVREGGEVLAFGAGLISSAGELARCPAHLPWDLESMAGREYDPTGYQEALFVAPSLERLLGDLGSWLVREGELSRAS